MGVETVGQNLTFEVLLGVVAVTTFLVGFSTVRVQASLQEWRERGERIVSRLLEQNAGQDLLPLPSTLRTLTGAGKKMTIDVITWLTLISTVVSFFIFLQLFFELQEGASSFESMFLEWLLFLLVLIVLVGFLDVILVKYKSSKELRRTPSRIFSQLEQELLNWARNPDKISYWRLGVISNKCQEFEQVIPDWCWISLIRYDIQQHFDLAGRRDDTTESWRTRVPFTTTGTDVVSMPLWLVRIATLQFRTPAKKISKGFNLGLHLPAVRRIRMTSEKTKDEDLHSLIAYVWASILIRDHPKKMNIDDDDHLSKITTENIRDINEFRKSSNDTFAELTLRCARRNLSIFGQSDESRIQEIENVQLPEFQHISWRQRIWNRILSNLRPVDIGSRGLG